MTQSKTFFDRSTQRLGQFSASIMRILWKRLPDGLKENLTLCTPFYMEFRPKSFEVKTMAIMNPDGIEQYGCFRFEDFDNHVIDVVILADGKFSYEKMDKLADSFKDIYET